MKAWFRAVSAGFGDPAPAQTVAGLMMLLLVLYTGYAIPKSSMIGALKWISIINVSVRGRQSPLVDAHVTVANSVWL
jgi:ATP-binding cassette, subfamily G (WHITE), member 2, SNQ2